MHPPTNRLKNIKIISEMSVIQPAPTWALVSRLHTETMSERQRSHLLLLLLLPERIELDRLSKGSNNNLLSNSKRQGGDWGEKWRTKTKRRATKTKRRATKWLQLEFRLPCCPNQLMRFGFFPPTTPSSDRSNRGQSTEREMSCGGRERDRRAFIGSFRVFQLPFIEVPLRYVKGR